jgi:hypothetical protein
MAKPKAPKGDDGGLRFVRSFRHWKTGKLIVAAPGKVFVFRAK